jgi:hypothetical protein
MERNMEKNAEYLKQLNDLWADEDHSGHKSPACSPLEFDVLTPPVSVAIDKLQAQCATVALFMEAGGELYERHFSLLGRSVFVVTRNDQEIKGYGETPCEAIFNWAKEVKR